MLLVDGSASSDKAEFIILSSKADIAMIVFKVGDKPSTQMPTRGNAYLLAHNGGAPLLEMARKTRNRSHHSQQNSDRLKLRSCIVAEE
jgi:hypothetical protein